MAESAVTAKAYDNETCPQGAGRGRNDVASLSVFDSNICRSIGAEIRREQACQLLTNVIFDEFRLNARASGLFVDDV